MKFSIKPVAAAITVALASTSAHAALTNQLGPAPPTGNGLYVAVWDNTSKHSEIVNLDGAANSDNQYADLTTTALNPTSAGGAFQSAVNPATGTGNVLQINFGTLPSFAATFGTPSQSTNYLLVSANSPVGLDVTNGTTFGSSQGLITLVSQNITGEIVDWGNDPNVATKGVAIDTTGAALWNAATTGPSSPIDGGGLGTPTNFGGQVGSSLNFFNTVKSGRTSATLTQFAGFWYLSSTGDLTYNVPSAVPLPAAFWLLGSGIAALGAIGRRRLGVSA